MSKVILWFLGGFFCLFLVFFLLGFRVGVVGSSSMSPAVMYGDIVCYKTGMKYTEGDIVAYKDSGRVVLHRVIKMGEIVAVAGDKNPKKIEEINREKILGKMVFKSAFLGGFIRIFPVILLIFLVILILYYFLRGRGLTFNKK